MKNNFLKIMAGLLTLAVISSCNKTSSLNGAGITVIAFPSTTVINSYNTAAGTQTFAIVEIRRDVPNQTVLNSTQTVSVKIDTAVISAYNTANSSSYTLLPASVYAYDASNPVANGVVTVTFGPGEFAKPIKIALDLTTLPASPVKSAIGFTITNITGGGQISAASKSAFVSVGAKNAYEASYTVTGYFFHPTTASGRAIASTKTMTTLSPTRVQAAHSDLAGYFLQFDVSASDNKLINYAAAGSTPAVPASGFMTQDNPAGVDFSGYAPAGPGIAPYTAATYNNTYNPTSKTFWMHYGYQSGGNGEATFTRQIYEKWVRQ